MDIVGSFGYAGQTIIYLDADKFCYISGTGIVIVDPSGPKDIIWRHEHGVNAVASHILQKRLAIAPKAAGLPVEIMDVGLQKVLFSLKNPTSVSVIALNFAKDASRLIAITDFTDNKIILWNAVTREILHIHALTEFMSNVSFNPGNASLILLHEGANVMTGAYVEILGTFELKLTAHDVLQDTDAASEASSTHEDKQHAAESEVLPLSYSNPVGFVQWASLDTLYMGTMQGYYFEVNITTKVSAVIGYGQSKAGDSPPSSSVLTSEFLIVGSVDGTLRWFPRKLIYAILSRQRAKNPIEASYFRPVKVAKLQCNKECLHGLRQLVVNPFYSSITAGAADGTIYTIGLELQETAHGDDDEEEDQDDPVAALLNALPALPELVIVEPFIHMQVGAVMCTKPMYIQVMKTQDGIPINEYSGTLSLFITGSHSGTVMFWRSPAATEADTPHNSLGIHKSTPRMPNAMSRVSLDLSSDGSRAAVTQMEIMSAVCKHGGRLLTVGTSDGWLEVWLVEAFESEDEDGEGDEEEGLFYIKITKVLRRMLFPEPVSIISTCDTKPLTVICSHSSHIVYVLAFHTSGVFVEISDTFSIVAENMEGKLVGFPRSSCWNKNNLWIVTDQGFFICVNDLSDKVNPDKNITSSIGYMATSIERVGAGVISSTGLFLLPGEISSKVIISASLPGATSDKHVAGIHDFFPVHIDHTTSVLCVARSLAGTLLATGCADGSVYIWKCTVSAAKFEMELVNKFRVHNSAVLAIEFSVESSLLMSCSADGSVFITTVDKVRALKKDPRAVSIKINEDLIRDAIALEEESESTTRLWSEIHHDQMVVLLRQKYNSSIRNVVDAVSHLKGKLQTMLKHNQECDEMERMDASEFVVDVAGEAAFVAENDNQVALIRKQYEDDCLKNELVAARIRSTCWDINEVHARCLLPIQEDRAEDVAVWSFAIKKYSDADIIKLDRVKRLRALEMRAQIAHGGGLIQLVPSGNTRSAWITAIEGSPVDITWLGHDGARWPCADVEGMLSTKERLEQESKKGSGKDGATAIGVNEEDEENAVVENDVTEHDVDFQNVFNLLYPPQAVRSQVQKRTQIMLLKDVCRKICAFFNQKFEVLCREKEDVIAAVMALNNRIEEILTELQLQEDVFKPALRDTEIPLSAIVVCDEELVNRPYISEVTIQKRLREEEERRKRELENAKDDSKGRALIDMMNGTLEVKRDVFAEASALQRPAWMDETPVDIMSDAQKKEVEEFEAKYKLLQEEQSKYKKSLEIELKRLRSDVKDLWRDFDDKVERLAKTRIFTEREILTHELYMSRIALGMADQDQLRKSLQNIETKVIAAETVIKEKQEKLMKLGEDVHNARETMNRVSEEEKGMVKTFPRDIRIKCDNQFDQETLKVLTTWFRYRPNSDDDGGMDETTMTGSEMNTFGFSSEAKKSSSLRSSRSNKYKSSRHKNNNKSHAKSKSSQIKSKNAGLSTSKGGKSATASRGQASGMRLGPMQEAALAMKEAQENLPATTLLDPFYSIILKQEREARHAEMIQPSADPIDIPDDLQIDQYFWSKLNELRSAHILKQIEATSTANAYNILKKKFDELVADESILKDNVRLLYHTREEILRNINVADKDLQCIVAIRQGQDEVDKDVVVTNYSDSALIPINVVDKYNSRIKDLGADKIGVLSRIKQFRRKINLLNWEARHTELESKHIEEYLTDLQLFRVTRNMQQLIRDGDDVKGKHHEKPSDPHSPKKDVLMKETSFRVDKIAKGKHALKRLLKTRTEENSQLVHRIEDLRRQIEERRYVLQSRSEARGEDADPAVTAMKRMKKVVMRRRLVDMSSLQAQEIEHLRQELEKLRDKTFPSFVKAFRTRIHTNPDDKLV